jgi:hypothetical protein
VVYTHEPHAGFWRRLGVSFMSIWPIESQLWFERARPKNFTEQEIKDSNAQNTIACSAEAALLSAAISLWPLQIVAKSSKNEL